MRKKILSVLLALALCAGLAMPAFAASTEAMNAANKLNSLGLFNGVGTNADGTPNYDLDRAPTRAEAVTMLVRLLGQETAAQNGTWSIPFHDVENWAKPYVGYAYANGLTSGTSATTFSGNEPVSATQYLTFVLRALGYSSGSDFAWDSAWTLTDKLGITRGQYGAASWFTRGDAAIVSAKALDATLKNSSMTLLQTIQDAPATQDAPTVQDNPTASVSIRFLNDTGSDFKSVYISAGNDAYWGSSLVNSALRSGMSISLLLPPSASDMYDIRVIDEDGRESIYLSVGITAGSQVSVTYWANGPVAFVMEPDGIESTREGQFKSAPAPDPAPTSSMVHFHNRTSYGFLELYIAAAGSPSLGFNLLGSTLPGGNGIDFSLPTSANGLYDICVVDEDGDEANFSSVRISAGSELSIYYTGDNPIVTVFLPSGEEITTRGTYAFASG